MKRIIFILIFFQFLGCYTKYGIVMGDEKNNVISSKPHVNYELMSYREKTLLFFLFFCESL